MNDTKTVAQCPCGSGNQLSQCCLPVIRGTQSATTAEQLLRARYVAFALGEIPFILSSHHSKTRNEVSEKEITEWSKGSEWLGLKIHQVEGGSATDTSGTIVFTVDYKSEGKAQEHSEKSLFEKEGKEWRFLDAQRIQIGTFRRTEPKIGRNDPCTCGSGKKFKKCCGLTAGAQ